MRLDGPVDLLDALPTAQGIAWIRGGTGFVAWGEAARLDPGAGPGRFSNAAEASLSLLRAIERVPDDEGPGPLVVGSFTFLRDAPGSWLILPAMVLRWTGEEAWLTVTGQEGVSGGQDTESLLKQVSDPGNRLWDVLAGRERGVPLDHSSDPDGLGEAMAAGNQSAGTSNGSTPLAFAEGIPGDLRTTAAPEDHEPFRAQRPTETGGGPETSQAPIVREHPAAPGTPDHRQKSDEEWMAAVASARDAIREGRLLKVVLARDVVVQQEAPFDTRVVARRLAERYPECWTFVCGGLVGASPELLVRREGANVHSLTLAGSARRGDDPAADEEAGRELLGSRKDRWEHELAVRFVRDTLTRACSELWVDPEPSLLRLANVQHLATNTYGLLAEPLDAVELAGRLHPGAAICGTPTVEALEVIRELEGMDRGHYAAPVGWMDAAGDGEWAIALRCAELSGAAPRRARLFAGAGIVAESDPASELEETNLKLRPMLSALETPQETRR